MLRRQRQRSNGLISSSTAHFQRKRRGRRFYHDELDCGHVSSGELAALCGYEGRAVEDDEGAGGEQWAEG